MYHFFLYKKRFDAFEPDIQNYFIPHLSEMWKN